MASFPCLITWAREGPPSSGSLTNNEGSGTGSVKVVERKWCDSKWWQVTGKMGNGRSHLSLRFHLLAALVEHLNWTRTGSKNIVHPSQGWCGLPLSGLRNYRQAATMGLVPSKWAHQKAQCLYNYLCLWPMCPESLLCVRHVRYCLCWGE